MSTNEFIILYILTHIYPIYINLKHLHGDICICIVKNRCCLSASELWAEANWKVTADRQSLSLSFGR